MIELITSKRSNNIGKIKKNKLLLKSHKKEVINIKRLRHINVVEPIREVQVLQIMLRAKEKWR